MKKLGLLFLLLFAISTIGCSYANNSIKGNGNETSKNFEVSNFSAVDASHAYEIELSVGNETSVKIETDENLMKYVAVSVKNNTLYIGIENNLNIRGKMKAYITTPNLNGISLSGACKINADGINSENFAIEFSGACSGNVSGKSNNVNVDLSGASKLNASELKSSNVKVDVSGASKCDIFSDNSLFVDASGASFVKVFGNPKDLKSDLSGASKVVSD
jgi:hypothetical protein